MAFLRTLPAPTLAALLGLAAFATFSTHDLLVKQLGASYSPFQIVFFSALLSFPLITLAMITDERPGTLRPVHPWWMLTRSLSGTTSAVAAFYAFTELPLSQVYAVIFAAPLMITVLAVPILGETVRLRRGLAVLVGFGGVAVVLNPSATEFGPGHIAALLAAATGALNAVIVRKIGQEERAVVMVLYPMMSNLVLMGAAMPFVYAPVAAGDLGLLTVVAALVLCAMALLVAAYRRGDAIIVAPMQYSQIIWAAVFGAVFFGEYPDAQTYIGTAIVAASGLYILRREASPDVSAHAPVSNTRTRIGHTVGLRIGQILHRDRKGE